MAQDSDRLHYEPLRDGEIRLLHFDDNNLTMNVHSLSDRPTYNALSYCWGTEKATIEILCRLSTGSPLAKIYIRPNLHTALDQVRKFSASPIWIDALCIDQTNDDDKAQQLPLMGKIYSNAAQVLIWLGPSENNSQLAMTCISWLMSDELVDREDAALSEVPEWFYPMRHAIGSSSELQLSDDALQSAGLPVRDHQIWSAFGHLYSRAWLGRLWTYQEVMLSSACSVLCGDAVVAWHSFFTMAHWLASTTLLFHAYSNVPRSANEFPDINRMRSFANPVDRGMYFWLHLREGRYRKALLQADHVYAIMSLATSEVREQIPLHYAKAVESENYWQLYVVTTRILLRHMNSFSIFQEATSGTKHPRLPSWSPDYSQPPDTVPFCTRARAGYFKATQIRLPSKLLMVVLVGGNVTDTVADVLDEYSCHWPRDIEPNIRGLSDAAASMLHWMGRCLEHATRALPENASHVEESLFRTLVADVSPHNQPEFPQDYLVQLPRLQDRLRVLAQTEPASQQMYSLDNYLFGQLQPLFTWLGRIWRNRMLISTTSGRLGFAHKSAQRGDKVCIFYGSSHPHILRQYAPNTRLADFQYISEAYVDGLMLGEAENILAGRDSEVLDLM